MSGPPPNRDAVGLEVDDGVARRLLGDLIVDALASIGVEVRFARSPSTNGAGDEISERVAALAEAAAESRQRGHRLEVVGAMAAGIVHEARNMVTSMKGFAEIARRKLQKNQDAGPVIDRIENTAVACRDSVSGLLGFIRAGDAPASDYEVNEALDEAANLVRHGLGTHGVRVELDLADGLPPVLGQPAVLRQVVVNLLLNAQQAMSDGGHVRVRSEASSHSVVVTVTDDGPGVPDSIRDEIFAPFFTTKPKGEGTGLGLAICEDLLARDGGTLRLGDDAGPGATFIVTLPAHAG